MLTVVAFLLLWQQKPTVLRGGVDQSVYRTGDLCADHRRVGRECRDIPYAPGDTAGMIAAGEECDRWLKDCFKRRADKACRCLSYATKPPAGDVFAGGSVEPTKPPQDPGGGGGGGGGGSAGSGRGSTGGSSGGSTPRPPGPIVTPRQPPVTHVLRAPLSPRLQQAVNDGRCSMRPDGGLDCPGYIPDYVNDRLQNDPDYTPPQPAPVRLYGGVTNNPKDSRFGLANINDADPPLLVTAKLMEGIDDCLKENLTGDLLTLPLSFVTQKARGLKTAILAWGYLSSAQSLIADMEALRQPGQSLGDVAHDVGKLLCEGYSMRDVLSGGAKQQKPEAPLWKTREGPSPMSRGITLMDDKALRSLAQKHQSTIVVRDSNPDAARWLGRDGHLPKPLGVKAKTLKPPTADELRKMTAGQAMEERFYRPHYGLASARGMDEAGRAALREKGYSILPKEQGELIVDGAGNRFYSDMDLHAVIDGAGNVRNTDSLIDDMNGSTLEPMVQHNAQDEFPLRNDPNGPSYGPQPPVTVYRPDGTTVHIQTMEEMRALYRELGVDWNALYPHRLEDYGRVTGKRVR